MDHSQSVARWGFVFIATIGTMLNLLSVAVMLRTKRLHFAIKTVCLNIMVYDVLFLLGEVIFHLLTISEHQTISLKISAICRNSVRNSWYLATFLSVERVIALEHPFLYRKYLTRRIIRLYMFFIFFVWLAYIIYRAASDDIGTQRKEWPVSCWVTTLFILTCGTIIICCYTRVLITCRRQVKQIIGKKLDGKVLKSTVFFLLITGSFILTHTPVVVESMVQKCQINLELDSYTYRLIFLYCAFNPIIYIWRFPACRLVFMDYLNKYTKCSRMPSFQRRIVKLRIEVYDYVLPITQRICPTTTHLQSSTDKETNMANNIEC